MANDAYALTLYTFLLIGYQEKLERNEARSDRFDVAQMTAVGFHQPKELRGIATTIEREYKEVAGLLEPPEVAMSKSVGLAAALMRAAEMDLMLAQQQEKPNG